MDREDKLKNRMIRLILPIAFQQFMLALVSSCDVVMLGRLSQDAMSAVSLASQVTFVFNLFMAAFVIGENMFLAQYYGKRDHEGISEVFRLVLGISAVTAAVFLVGTALFPEIIMRILTSEQELVRLGSVYLRYVGVSYLLSAVSQVYLAYMKNCGALTGLLLLALSPAITGLVSLTPVAKSYLKGMLLMSSYYFVGKSVNSMTVGGIFPAGGDTSFGLLCDTVTLWCVTIPLGCLCAFLWRLPVPAVYFVLNLDEIVKLPAVYRHYRKYGWVKNIT